MSSLKRRGGRDYIPTLEEQRREGTLKLENAQDLVRIQNNIRANLNKLLNRDRPKRDRESFRREGCWLEWPEEQFLIKMNVLDASKYFLKMIVAFDLQEEKLRVLAKNKSLKRLSRLHELVDRQWSGPPQRCPICKDAPTMSSSNDIRKHIFGPVHARNLDLLE